MTILVCDKCKKPMEYADSYTLHVCFDTKTELEKDVCKHCKKSLMATINKFFKIKEEEQDVGD